MGPLRKRYNEKQSFQNVSSFIFIFTSIDSISGVKHTLMKKDIDEVANIFDFYFLVENEKLSQSTKEQRGENGRSRKDRRLIIF